MIRIFSILLLFIPCALFAGKQPSRALPLYEVQVTLMDHTKMKGVVQLWGDSSLTIVHYPKKKDVGKVLPKTLVYLYNEIEKIHVYKNQTRTMRGTAVLSSIGFGILGGVLGTALDTALRGYREPSNLGTAGCLGGCAAGCGAGALLGQFLSIRQKFDIQGKHETFLTARDLYYKKIKEL
ncbi:MAG: hypothetical protein JNL57_12980 [Bacteroidetes bacterium]|nr:hypothetical protein [Bacteroidota bacterium]